MTVYAGATINPKTIVSGQSIRIFDTSYAVGEVISSMDFWINETKTVTMSNGSPNLVIANASTNFVVGETVIANPTVGGFYINTTYYVLTTTSTYITLSLTRGGSPVYATANSTTNLYKGCMNIPYPVLFPYPVESPVSRNIVMDVYGSGGGSAPHSANISIPFYTQISSLIKPITSSNFSIISIFIYKPHPYSTAPQTGVATIINRRWTPNNGFIYSDLTFKDSINKSGTATFTITAKGTQTADEETLLLSDNCVVIIAGNCVAWSGKILRSEQSKMTLFNSSSNAKQWDIECETDISKLRTQNINPANKGTHIGSIGYVVTKLLEPTIVKTLGSPRTSPIDYTFNGDSYDPALRSTEGPDITYNITDADMFNQLSSLRSVIDFDVRTRLLNYRLHYNSRDLTEFLLGFSSFSPYPDEHFSGMWVLFPATTTLGITSYGRVVDNTLTTMRLSPRKNWDLIPTSGDVIVLGEPVVDMVSDLSQPTQQANFIGNSVKSTTLSNGYEFNDKTDRKLLATKVVAKGKASNGTSITCAMAAVTPWNQYLGAFDGTTTITSRTEGTVIETNIITSGSGAGVYVTLEGWGYPGSGYFAVKTVSGAWKAPSYQTLIMATTETYSGTQRITVFNFLYIPASGWYNAIIGDLLMITTAIYPPTAPFYGYFFIENPVNLGYIAGANIYIGGETIQTTSLTLDSVKGYKVGYLCDGTALHREATNPLTQPHSTGASVYMGTGYSETSPIPGSPVNYHGIILQTYTVDQNITPATLELYASMCLIAYSYYYMKASFWCQIYDFFKIDARGLYEVTATTLLGPGDRIVFLPKSTDTINDTLYGQLRNIWQIVSFTVDANTMQVQVELGDFERNVFTLLADKTAAINSTIT